MTAPSDGKSIHGAAKKDPESLEEEEMKQIIEDSDFDGPLVDYEKKGNRVEFIGMEDVEGTATFKLKLTLKDGDVQYYIPRDRVLSPHKDRY